MMENRTILTNCFFVMALLLTGCATSGKNNLKNVEKGQAQVLDSKAIQELRTKELEKIDQEIAAKVDHALKGDEKGKVYLANDLFFKASALVMEGDYQSANIVFEHLTKLEPNDYFLKKKYAVSLIRMGELDKSVAVLEDLLKIGNEDKEEDGNISLILAGVHGTLGNTDKAVAIYRQILKKDPGNEDACVFYSKSMVSEKDVKGAIKLLENCSRKDKKKGIFDYYIGKIHVDQSDLKSAKLSFKKSVKKQPDFNQSVMALGLIHEELKEEKAAIALYKSHLKKYPDESSILSRVVQLLFNLKRFDEVIPYAERLSDSEPSNLNLKVRLGILYTEKEDYRKAISVFKELLQHTPENDNILYYVGAIYQQLKMHDNAIDYYSKISQTSNLYDDSSMQIAKMLVTESEREFRDENKIGKVYEKFNKHIEDMMTVNPKVALDVSTLHAGFLESVGETQGAISAIEKVKNHKDFNDSYIFYLASLYEKTKEFEKSNQLVLDILEKNPENAHAWNYLGYSLLERGVRLDLAHEYIVRALTLMPHDGYIRDSLGWYYYKVGKYENAVKELLHASQFVGEDYSVLKHLSIVYASMKKFNSARKWAQKAIKNVSNNQELAVLKSLLSDIENSRVPASN